MPDSKKKSPIRRQPPPIEVVSPLQLDECVYRLRNKLDAADFKVFVDLEEQNCRKFTLQQYRGDKTMFYGEGTLRRWQGTSTYLEIHTIIGHSIFTRTILWLSWWIFIIALLSLLLPSLAVSMQPFAAVLLLIVLFILIRFIYRQLAHGNHAIQHADIREYLTTLLSDLDERPDEIEVHEIPRARQRHAGNRPGDL